MPLTSTQGEVAAALRAADPAAPEALAIFDRIAGAAHPTPDFIEWSAQLTGACDAARLTYYFDAARQGEAGLRAVGGRFAALGDALGAAVPPALLEAFSALVPGRREVQQLVLGLDDRPGGARRVKLYVVLQEAAEGLVDGLIAAAGARRPEALDAAKVYILGLDCGAAGISDAKLYFRLDRARLGRVVSNLREVSDLVKGTREVVLQRCLLSDRSQIYLHATDAHTIAGYLARRAWGDAATAQLNARHRAAAAHLAHGRLEPWIISFGLRDHQLQWDASNVYYHHTGVG